MFEPTEMLLGIGIEWLAIAGGMLVFNVMRPGRIISIKAMVILGTVLLLVTLVGYFVILVASGLGHSACAGRQTRAAFPLLFTGLFAAPTVVLSMYRWYQISRMRSRSAPGDPEAARSCRSAETATSIAIILSVALVVALSGRAGLWPPVMYAVSRGLPEQQVTRLLELGFSPEAADVCGRKPLVFAVLTRNKPLVRILLDFGANPNQTNNEDDPPPPLWWAAFRGALEPAKLLIDKGANVNGVGSRIPLMAASHGGNLELVKLLVDKGAQVNARNAHGTPLSAAAEADRTDIMRFLMEKGADIEGKDVSVHWTPLMRAAAAGSANAMKLLLEKGANPHFRDIWKDTPRSIAEKRGHPNVAELLPKDAPKNPPEPK